MCFSNDRTTLQVVSGVRFCLSSFRSFQLVSVCAMLFRLFKWLLVVVFFVSCSVLHFVSKCVGRVQCFYLVLGCLRLFF